MQYPNQGTTQKINRRLGQNYTLASRTDKKHRSSYTAIKSYIEPATTTQKQRQLSRSGKKYLELGKTINQHLNQSRTQEIDSHVTPEPTNTV